MHPIDFKAAEWHNEATKHIVEVRPVQVHSETRFSIFVNHVALCEEALPKDDPLILLASKIIDTMPAHLREVAQQAMHTMIPPAHRITRPESGLLPGESSS